MAEVLLVHVGNTTSRQDVVWLDCENKEKSCGLWVRHIYDGFRKAEGEDGKVFMEILYKCLNCGHVKRFGTF